MAMPEWEREMYSLHAKSDGYKRRIDVAFKIAETAMKDNPGKASLSYSGGKDSTVLLDICYQAGFRGDLVQFYYSHLENPKMNQDMADSAAEKYGLRLHRLKCYSSMDAWNEVGHFFVVPITDEEKRTARKAGSDFRAKALALTEEQGYVLQFIGMRKQESKRRQMVLGSRGLTYYAKTRNSVTCCPIGKLTGDDIWGYIVSHDLPYLPCYDYPEGDRRRIRNEITYMCVRNAFFRGVVEEYQAIYPEVFAELRMRYGDIGSYTR